MNQLRKLFEVADDPELHLLQDIALRAGLLVTCECGLVHDADKPCPDCAPPPKKKFRVEMTAMAVYKRSPVVEALNADLAEVVALKQNHGDFAWYYQEMDDDTVMIVSVSEIPDGNV